MLARDRAQGRLDRYRRLKAVAEGVETAEQADTLYLLGYRYAQGYQFSRPLSPAQVGERLTAYRSRTTSARGRLEQISTLPSAGASTGSVV